MKFIFLICAAGVAAWLIQIFEASNSKKESRLELSPDLDKKVSATSGVIIWVLILTVCFASWYLIIRFFFSK